MLKVSFSFHNFREEHQKQQGYAEHLQDKSDFDFFRNLRVRKETFEDLLTKFEESYLPQHTGGREPVLPRTSLYVTLCYLGNQDTYRQLSELFGISEAAVHKCVNRGVKFLCSLGPESIKWPSQEKISEVAEEFRSMAGFPGVIGAVDGCHIKIKAPDNVQADFIDRTSTHSVNLMAVCTRQKKFTFIDAGYPGSAHDTTVFRHTKLYELLNTNPNALTHTNFNHVIGDSGFQLAPYLLVPYKDYGNLTSVQSKFNKKLSQTRHVIENAFGFLKGRFRRLKYLDVDLERIPDIILACCVLHNITLGNPQEEESLLADGFQPPPFRYDNFADAINLPPETGGAEKRDFIAELL